MKQLIRSLIVLLLFPFGIAAQELGYSRDSSGIDIYEGNRKVLHYQVRSASMQGQYPRANYIHPLYGLDGEILTEDFPDDHLHHRGIFWAWHQVLVDGRPMGDSWECKDFIWDISKVEVVPADTLLIIKSNILWKSPALPAAGGGLRPFVLETTEIRVHPQSEEMQVIDFDISLLALVQNLSLGGSQDEKGYGGFSARVKMPDGIWFSSEKGRILPQETAVNTASWINISGALGAGGKTAGLLIFDRNQADGNGTSWILREKGSMQNVVYPGRNPVPISMETPTVLRYRLVVYNGQLSREQIALLKPLVITGRD